MIFKGLDFKRDFQGKYYKVFLKEHKDIYENNKCYNEKLIFIEEKDIFSYPIKDINYLRSVEIPDEAIIEKNNVSISTNCFILKEKINVEDLDCFIDYDFLKEIIQKKKKGWAFYKKKGDIYVKNVIKPKFNPHWDSRDLNEKYGKELINYKRCIKSIEEGKGSKIICFIHDDDIESYIALKAFENNYKSFKFLPEILKTEEMCKKVMELDKKYFKYIPDSFKTEEMCLEFFNLNIDFYPYIPKKYQTKEMFLKAIKHNPEYFKYGKKSWREEKEIYEECISKYGYNIEFIDKRLHTFNLCISAINSRSKSCKYFSEEFLKNEDIYNYAIIKNSYNFRYFYKYLNMENIKNGIKINGNNIKYLNEEDKTPEIHRLAYNYTPKSIRYFSREYKLIFGIDAYKTNNEARRFLSNSIIEEIIKKIKIE